MLKEVVEDVVITLRNNFLGLDPGSPYTWILEAHTHGSWIHLHLDPRPWNHAQPPPLPASTPACSNGEQGLLPPHTLALLQPRVPQHLYDGRAPARVLGQAVAHKVARGLGHRGIEDGRQEANGLRAARGGSR